MVKVEGPIIRTNEVAGFLKECESLYESLQGEASLDCMEPNLHVRLSARSLGHIDVDVQLTPDNVTEQHSLRVSIDQTHLPAIIEGAKDILSRFPVRGKPRSA